jgi:glycosyltransferase involved in cell wall biosynthesis
MAKVLLVTDIFPPQIGGPATFIDRLGHSLAQRGHKVTVVCSSARRSDPSDVERPFTVRRVSIASRERYEVEVRARLALEMARHRLVFVNGLERYVADVNRVVRRPYVLKIVGDRAWELARNRGLTNLSIDEFQKDAAAQRQFAGDIGERNRCVNGARHIVVPSEYLRGIVEGWGVPRSRVSVILNGTVAPAPRVVPTMRGRFEALRVAFVGRLTNWKGIETLLLAAQHLPHIAIDIVGDGPEWPHLTELAAQLRLGDRVTFTGRLAAPQVQEAMRRAHLLVLTSLYEGLSHTVLEAFANGLPCVVSDRGGNEEAVTNGRNGLVVPAQNVERLVTALDAIAADEPLRRRMASAALDTAREFDIAATVARTERILLCGTAQTEQLVQSAAAFGQVERP